MQQQRIGVHTPNPEAVKIALSRHGLSKQGRVHLLLTAFPVLKIDQAYEPIFEKLLKEEVSTSPVVETGRSRRS